MPKRYKENIAYADRQRKAQREKKMSIPVDQPITFSGLGEYIRQSEQYHHMQKTLGGGIPSSMGVPAGVLGYVLDYTTAPTITVTSPVSGSGYCISEPQPSSPDDQEYMVVSAAEINSLKAELADAKIQIAERDEMIEALVADMEDIEVLRAENDALKELAFPLHTADAEKTLTPGEDGWVEWHGVEDGSSPPDAIVEIKFRNNSQFGSHHNASTFRWNHSGRGSRDFDIVAYRIVG